MYLVVLLEAFLNKVMIAVVGTFWFSLWYYFHNFNFFYQLDHKKIHTIFLSNVI